MKPGCLVVFLAMLVASSHGHYGYKSSEIRKQVVSPSKSAPIINPIVKSSNTAGQVLEAKQKKERKIETPVLDVVTEAPISSVPVVSSYGSAPLTAPIVEQVPLAPTTEVVSTVAVPEFDLLCASKRLSIGSLSVFYLAHPTDRSLYIQCDESGKAFLKRCPVETVFTENLVCERIGLELPVRRVETPVLDVVTEAPISSVPVVSSYGSAPLTAPIVKEASVVPVSVERPVLPLRLSYGY